MEGRPSRGRGGSWKRGGRGGHDGADGHGGEYRGRGRGGHHRGRGRRDHYRGRGRGGGGHSEEHNRRDQDEVDFGSDDHVTETFSRRKLESNWDRYKASETQEAEEATPTQRGTDYSVLLQSAGDSFTQFRFADEKDWEMDSFVASQVSAFVDLAALAQSLQQVPLHRRLNLEAQLIQISTPVELPSQLPPKQEVSRTSALIPPPSTPVVSSEPLKPAPSPGEDMDEELDELLSLHEPAYTDGNLDLESEGSATGKASEEVKKDVPEVALERDETEEEEVRDKHVTEASVKKELTEEELEDWLDSMIS